MDATVPLLIPEINADHLKLLDVQAKVPNATADKFNELAEAAKKGCPISRALSATPISMTAKLL